MVTVFKAQYTLETENIKSYNQNVFQGKKVQYRLYSMLYVYTTNTCFFKCECIFKCVYKIYIFILYFSKIYKNTTNILCRYNIYICKQIFYALKYMYGCVARPLSGAVVTGDAGSARLRRRSASFFAPAHKRHFLFCTRSRETRWATSSSTGVTPENTARDPGPGQFCLGRVFNVKGLCVRACLSGACLL